jgi:hypothetical protein
MRTSMTAPEDWTLVEQQRQHVEASLQHLVKRAGAGHANKEEAERVSAIVQQRARSLLDSWKTIVEQSRHDAAKRAYSPYDPGGKGLKPLLRTVLDDPANATQDELKFEAPLSMRDVEASVHLWLTRQPLGGYKAPKVEAPAPDAMEKQEVPDGR